MGITHCFRRTVHVLDALDIQYTIPVPFKARRVAPEEICRAEGHDDVTLCADSPRKQPNPVRRWCSNVLRAKVEPLN
jgi:hypothetical protein